MAMYVISYDLANPTGSEYFELDAHIKQEIDRYPQKLTDSTYFVQSSMIAKELLSNLLPYFRSDGDKLIIVEVGKSSAYGGNGLNKTETEVLSLKLATHARF